MARKKQAVTKGVESVNIEFADNGYIVIYSGQDDEDNWTDAKVILQNLQDVFALLEKLAKN